MFGITKKMVVFISVIILIAIAIGHAAITDKSASSSMNDQSVSFGGQAPDFALPMVNESAFHLDSYKGKSNVLLFFNEGLDCTPCLNQIVDLDKDYNEFKS
ncbi:MAG: redoxin domain-containing protein, partial [Patescibacteria group bacterium]|nr:redoxin domain-containing protein [Patescibacteria group bacterium]